jgi:hypothetical protein
MVLLDQSMPPDDLRMVVTSDDPELIRRHLELHRERLEERLRTQRRRVDAIEQILSGEARSRQSATPAREVMGGRTMGTDPLRRCIGPKERDDMEDSMFHDDRK